ncbi:MAG TPA: hypothetical protein ENK14_09235, partial [Caldithrix sp.]|nr:hypothetical protein [Caldithrix sp.]
MEVYSIKNSGPELSKAQFLQLSTSQGRQPKPEKNEAEKQKPVQPAKHDIQYPKLLEIAQQVRDKLKSANVNIQFEIDRANGRIVIMVMDPVSGEVVRKIPPKEFAQSVDYLSEVK